MFVVRLKGMGTSPEQTVNKKKQLTERWLTKFLTHRPSPTWNCSSQEKLLPNWSNELMAKTLNKSTFTSCDFSINPLCNHLTTWSIDFSINWLFYQLTCLSINFSINQLFYKLPFQSINFSINQLFYQLTFLPIIHVSASEGKNEVANFSFLFVQRLKFCLPKQHFWWWCHSSGDQESTKIQSDHKEQNES